MEPNKNRMYVQHYEDNVTLPASPEEVFAFLDDHTHFSSHMNKSSWMMGGSNMQTKIDSGHFKEIGSHIQMSGKIFGFEVFLDQVLISREMPYLKIWETVGTPKLVVIDHYRMTAKIEPKENGAVLHVSIDYNLPTKNIWLGKLFGGYYAKWCVEQMIKGSQSHFDKKQ